MTTSGTATYNPSIMEYMEEAFERAGRRLKGGYDYRTGRRSLDIMTMEWANRGLNLWLVQQGTLTMIGSQPTYTLPADTIDIIEAVYRTNTGTVNQTDVFLNRISVSDYAAIPVKLQTGSQPYQYYVDRQETPVVYVWPVPDGSQAATINYWRLRRIQDSGSPASNTMDVPFRFVPALVAGLAYYIAGKIPEGLARQTMLKQDYMEQFQLAADEDRDRASVRFTPFVDFSSY